MVKAVRSHAGARAPGGNSVFDCSGSSGGAGRTETGASALTLANADWLGSGDVFSATGVGG